MPTYSTFYSNSAFGGKNFGNSGSDRDGVFKATLDIAAESAARVAAGLPALAVGDVLTLCQMPTPSLLLFAGLICQRASTSTTSTLTLGSSGGAAMNVSGALNGKTAGFLPGTVTNGQAQPTDSAVYLTLTITAETTIANAGKYDVYAEFIDLT